MSARQSASRPTPHHPRTEPEPVDVDQLDGGDIQDDLDTVPMPDILPEVATTPEHEAVIDQFGAIYPFPLDEFQRRAIRVLLNGESVMVAAPTGSGKTVVAEFGIYNALRGTGRVLYTAPIKALSNQKFRDLRAIYGDEVGLLTGDVSENRDARVIVMTTEILRNMLLQSPWELDDVDCVIFDEIHYLADPERGTTWEESIILCPDHIQFICLSATVTNAEEIAGWIGRTHRPIQLITHNRRPVPLSLYYFVEDELHQVVDHHGKRVKSFNRLGGEARRQPGRPGYRKAPDRQKAVLDEPQAREIVDALAKENLLPAIYFLFSRNDCQTYAERLAMVSPHLLKPGQLEQVDAVVQTYLDSMRPEDLELEQVLLITRLARKGIGFHHAGLLPILKQLVEVLFSRGLMQVVFATDTLALGVNMPARTVVIGRMTKWDGRRRRILTPNEFQQMAGRAGRRGMDAFGHVVMPYSAYIPYKEMLEVATGALLPVQSAFAIRYNTVLNLWDPPHGDRVRQMLQRSLAQYQTSQRIRFIEHDVLEIDAEIAGLLAGRDDEIAALDESYEEYQRMSRELQLRGNQEKRLEQERADLRLRATASTPWTPPGRQALRKAFRAATPGLVAHTRENGWGIYLGRGASGGAGIFLCQHDSRIRPFAEYRSVDFLPDDKHIPIPVALIEPPETVSDPAELVSADELASIWQALAALDLPDLDAIAAGHRASEAVVVAESEDRLASELAEVKAESTVLKQQLAAHPFHDTALRKEHQRFLRHRDELEKERSTLADILTREIDAEDVRIRNVIQGIRDVLHRFGYMRRGYPTEKADMLADIFDGDGLILCELIDRGVLDPLSPDELAELFSWFSFDREFRYANHFTLPERLLIARTTLDAIERDVLGEERDHKLFISEGHNPSFYGAALHWGRGWSMVQIGEQLELSEGDLVLTFNKTIDLMRQVRDMLEDLQPEHPLVDALARAEKRLRRGIVEQSLTLGFAPIASADVPAVAVEDDEDDLFEDGPDDEVADDEASDFA
ncbi:MAG: DEAD/DEAH box helicase [Thermomicrobiales bacterium]